MVWQDFNQKVFRFAVLKHVRQADIHWDLLLQLPDRPLLATWHIDLEPARWCSELKPISAIELPDHRLVYLDFQGDISGGRGHVVRVDGGGMEIFEVQKNKVHCRLHGQLLHGAVALMRTASPQTTARDHWQLRFTGQAETSSM